ncbi:MAG TPA: hypothetical protein VGZ29_11930 [Terriglobia bacterium]|nr:hypothetical protein [Terriglobia bacterium]
MTARLRALSIIAAIGLFCLPAAGQQVTGQTPGSFDVNSAAITGQGGVFNSPWYLQQKPWVVQGVVKDLDGNPVQGAKVTLEPMNGSAQARPFQTDVLGRFDTQLLLNANFTRDLRLQVLASKKGYLKAHETVHFLDADKVWVIVVTLRSPQADADLLSPEDLIPALTSRLKSLGPADGLSPKSEKDYARGVDDLLVRNRPDHAVGPLGSVVERDPACLDCRVMLALADVASGDWDSADRDLGNAVSTSVKDHKAAREEPLLLYGILQSWHHNYSQAAAYCIEALKHAPKDPLALQEAGRAELMLENWPAADSFLAQALAAGAGPDAKFLRVKALLNEGATDQAHAEMERFLNGRDIRNMPLDVRVLYTLVQQKKKIEITYARKARTEVAEPIDYLQKVTPELKTLRPAADQSPLAGILSAVGKNVADSFKNYPNTSSLERVHQEKLGRHGKGKGSLDGKFYYLCVTPQQSWGPGFSELRAPVDRDQGQPSGLKDGFMLTSGFTSASLIFHPAYQAQSEFRYLGRETVDGVDAYVLAFAQLPAKSKLYGTFKDGNNFVTTFTQGLAWINPQTYEILRLRTDLLKPLPDVKLSRQTTDINYGEVHFKGVDGAFWLPHDVTVTVSWDGRNLRNEHQYSGFRVFNVASTEKVSKPKTSRQEASGRIPNPTTE